MATTINMQKIVRAGNDFSPRECVVSATITTNGTQVAQVGKINGTIVEVLEDAIKMVQLNGVKNNVANENITVSGFTLPAGLQTSIKDRYELEAEIGTITFA